MRFKPGDIVIKSTGGNKMTVFNSVNEKHECIWVTDKVNQDTFSDDELLTMEEYKKSLKSDERDDKINQLFKYTNPEKGKFIDLKGKYKSKFDSFKGKLVNPKWQQYFDKITICENMDFQDVIEKYDSPTTYFYCDPPYYKTEDYYANHVFGIETHERLANTLKAMKGKFSLSYYHFDLLEEWFPRDQYKWEAKEFAKAAMAKAGKAQTKGVELLIMNY